MSESEIGPVKREMSSPVYVLRGGAYLLDEHTGVLVDSAGNYSAKTRGNPLSLVVMLRAIADDIGEDVAREGHEGWVDGEDSRERSLFTPSTNQIRTEWIESGSDAPTPRIHAAAAFDRWLAVHDAEVARKALTDAADELSAYYPEDVFRPMSDADHKSVNDALAGRLESTHITRDRVSADVMRRAFNLVRDLAEQIGEH